MMRLWWSQDVTCGQWCWTKLYWDKMFKEADNVKNYFFIGENNNGYIDVLGTCISGSSKYTVN